MGSVCENHTHVKPMTSKGPFALDYTVGELGDVGKSKFCSPVLVVTVVARLGFWRLGKSMFLDLF